MDDNPLKRLFEKRGAVYRSTPMDVVARMLALAKPEEGEVLYDLGCGDGRVLVAAAENYDCRAIGFDSTPERVAEARQRVASAGLGALISIEERDIYRLDLTPADVVTLYLSPEPNRMLIPQLRQLRPGSRIVSHDFGLEGIAADSVATMVSEEDGVEHAIFLWRAPLLLS